MKPIPYIVCSALLFAVMGCKHHQANVPDSPEEPIVQDTTVVDEPTIPDDNSLNLDYLFDIQSLPQVRLDVSLADWNTYLSNFDQWPNNRLYVPADWTFIKDGVTYHRSQVGIRPRGQTSRRRAEGYAGVPHQQGGPWVHSHYGISFAKYNDDARFFGNDRLILKYAKEDPTYVREVFSYDLMRRFGVWSAPRASYCRFSIHVEGDAQPVYLGVYIMIENPRKGWLADRFARGYLPDEDGFMWKAAWGANLSDPNADMGVSDDYGDYTPIYDLKTRKKKLAAAQQELQDFINGLIPLVSGAEQTKQWLNEHMDVDLFLRAMAVDAMVGQWDGYWGDQNNYLFYFDKQHRFYFIPFDYDNTLGTGQYVFGNPGTQDLLYWGPRDYQRLLTRKVLSIPEFETTYKRYIYLLAEDAELMKPSAAMARVRRLQELIAEHVANDTGEDNAIADRTASWGQYPYYRLLSGEVSDGLSVPTNFFRTKVQSISFPKVEK